MEKLLVTSNFSFSHNVFKSWCFQKLMCLNEYLWSKGLKLAHIVKGSRAHALDIQSRLNPWPPQPINLPFADGVSQDQTTLLVQSDFDRHFMGLWFETFPSLAVKLYFRPRKPYCDGKELTLYQIIPTINDPEKETFWKHCEKRRKSW